MKASNHSSSNRIASLQGLRACGFLMIFISHSVEGYASFGAAGVSIFLILSGFLMTYNYYDRRSVSLKPTAGESFRFAVRKVGRLYPLHLVTMVFTLCLILLQPERFSGAKHQLLIKIGLNLVLLQSWIPKSEFYFSLNSVSWYLSTAMVTYFFFPWLLVLLRRISRKRSAFIALLLIVALEAALSCVFQLFGRESTADWFSLHWLTYIFPQFRILDFSVGALGGYLFLHRDNSASLTRLRRLPATGLETLLFLSIFVFCRFYSSVPQSIRYTLLFTVPSALLVCLLASRIGYVSLLLSRKPFQVLGKLSTPAFLIHMLVIRIGQIGISKIFPQLHLYLSALLLLVITLLLSAAWGRIEAFVRRKTRGRTRWEVFHETENRLC